MSALAKTKPHQDKLIDRKQSAKLNQENPKMEIKK